ncbi:hypothetical protein ABFU52_18635 [Xanthomonas campestris pv. campestris]
MNVLIAALLCALAGTAVAQDIPPGYAGQGGMTLQEIDPAIYAYHYDHGFDVPPILSSASVWSPIPYPEEIGREETFY